jgi:hypothetical protein
VTVRTGGGEQFHLPDGSLLSSDEVPAARCLLTGEAVTEAVVGGHTGRGAMEWHRADARPVRREGRLVGAVMLFEDVTPGRPTPARLSGTR